MELETKKPKHDKNRLDQLKEAEKLKIANSKEMVRLKLIISLKRKNGSQPRG